MKIACGLLMTVIGFIFTWINLLHSIQWIWIREDLRGAGCFALMILNYFFAVMGWELFKRGIQD